MQKNFFTWITLVLIFKQLVWVAFIPPWQFPDEQAHFGQVQNFAENLSTSNFSGPNTSKEIEISESLLGTRRDGFGNNQFTYHPEYKLSLDRDTVYKNEQILLNIPSSFRTQREIHEATVYPPLYYVLSAVFYRSVYSADFLTRIFFVRFINVPIFLGIAFFTYRVGRILFKKDIRLQTLLLILVTFQPMFSFVSGGTTSDNLYNFLSTATIYLCLVVVQKGFSSRKALQILFTGVLLWFTKPQAKLLFLLFGATPFFTTIKNKKSTVYFFLLVMVSVILTIGYFVLNIFLGRQLLPDIPMWEGVISKELSFFSHFKWTLMHTYREVMPWYWGVYRWLSLTYPRTVHRVINWLVLFALFGLVAYVTKKKKIQDISPRLVWFLIFSNAVYFLGLFAFDYLFRRSHQFSFGIQGRYYFPLIVSQQAILLIGWYTLAKKFRWSSIVLCGVGILSIVFHLYAQFFVGLSYLTPATLSDFFVQLGFYKPWFFKSPYLPILFSAYIASLLVCLWYYVRIWSEYEKGRT